MVSGGCGNNGGKERKGEVEESGGVEGNVSDVSKGDLVGKVYNYEKNGKEWK